MTSENLFWREKINRVVNDRENGSSFLLKTLLLLLENSEYSQSDFEWAKKELDTIDDSMSVVYHFLDELKSISSVKQVSVFVRDYQNRYQSTSKGILLKLGEEFDLNAKTVLTHSNSQTIQEVLCMASTSMAFKVFQTLSIPEEEGRIQFSRLKECNVSVEILQDDHVFQFINRLDACIMGVDQFDQTHWVNKKGSAEITRIAADRNIPVFVLADNRKKVKTVQASSTVFELVPFLPCVRLITV